MCDSEMHVENAHYVGDFMCFVVFVDGAWRVSKLDL